MERNQKRQDKIPQDRRRGRFLIRTGLLLLAAALFLTVYNLWDGMRADCAAQEAVEKLAREIEDRSAVSQTEENSETQNPAEALGELSSEREMRTIEIDGYRYVGYLEIPSLAMKLPVMEEWDYDRLKIAPCLYSGSVYRNDMVIAGHNYRRHFSPLRYQELGTGLTFTDVEGEVFYYRISDVEILEPTQIEELVQDTDDWDLTLFTCTIGGQTRYVIRCVREDFESAKHEEIPIRDRGRCF